MSLRPTTLTAANLAIAAKPTVGYEQQLFISPKAAIEVGTFTIDAAASGTWSASAAGAGALTASPKELIAVLRQDADFDTTDLIISVTGTDAAGAALTSITGTIAPPSYAEETAKIFPRSWAVQIGTGASVFKTVTSVTITAGGANVVGLKFKLFGIPAVSTFRQVACKTQMNFDLKAPMPTTIQCGRDMGAFVKPGDIPVGSFDISAKILNLGDGIFRFNGVNVTGLVKEVKEDKVGTMNCFFMGMVLTVKPSVAEGVEPGTIAGTGLFEDCGILLPLGP